MICGKLGNTKSHTLGKPVDEPGPSPTRRLLHCDPSQATGEGGAIHLDNGNTGSCSADDGDVLVHI